MAAADTCPQAANHCALFWVWDDELKFYNLEAWYFILINAPTAHLFTSCIGTVTHSPLR